MRTPAILLPGGVLPAELAYGALIEALGDEVEVVAKDLELYADETPPPGYTLEHEIGGILHAADARGWERFHLGGYSGGGAAALAFAAHERERVLSLALLEPAWAGNDGLSREEEALWDAYGALRSLPPEEFMPAFARLGLRPGVEPPAPPPGPVPPWMARRPPGLRALMTTFETYDLDLGALRGYRRPVYFALGALSNPDQYERMTERLAGIFPDFTLEVFEERHHFDPPHRVEPERLAASLHALWARAES